MSEPDEEQILDDELRANGITPPSSPVHSVKLDWERRGMGWQATFERQRMRAVCRKIRDKSDGLHCELTIQTMEGLNVFRARVNLSSLTARTSLTKHLTSRRPETDWEGFIERLGWDLPERLREKDTILVLDNKLEAAPHSFLMEPMLELNEPTILFAPGGAGKSTFAAAIAVSVASGLEVVPGWMPYGMNNVMILDWEGSMEIWLERVKKIRNGLDIPDHDTKIHYRGVTGGTLEDIVEEIAEDRDLHSIGLFVVDSVGLAMGAGSEHAGVEDSTLRLFQALRFVNRTALLIDHVNAESLKGNMPGMKTYGSIYKMNLARNVFELRRERDPAQGQAQFVLHHTKVNHSARMRPTGLRINYLEDAITFGHTQITAEELRQGLPIKERMVQALQFGPMRSAPLAEELDVAENALRQTMHRHPLLFGRTDDGRICLLTQMEFEGGQA